MLDFNLKIIVDDFEKTSNSRILFLIRKNVEKRLIGGTVHMQILYHVMYNL
jgi:hypothetical protein